MADSEHVLFNDGLHPWILFHLEHRLVAVQFQVGDFRWDDSQAVVLNVQLTQASQLSDFAWEFQKIVVATPELKWRNETCHCTADSKLYQASLRFANSSCSGSLGEDTRSRCRPSTRHEGFLEVQPLVLALHIQDRKFLPSLKKFPGKTFSFKLLYDKSNTSSIGKAPKPLKVVQILESQTISKTNSRVTHRGNELRRLIEQLRILNFGIDESDSGRSSKWLLDKFRISKLIKLAIPGGNTKNRQKLFSQLLNLMEAATYPIFCCATALGESRTTCWLKGRKAHGRSIIIRK